MDLMLLFFDGVSDAFGPRRQVTAPPHLKALLVAVASCSDSSTYSLLSLGNVYDDGCDVVDAFPDSSGLIIE